MRKVSFIALFNTLTILIIAIISTNNIFAESKFRVSKLQLFEKLLCRDEDFSFIEFENFTLDDSRIDSIKIIGKDAEDFKIEKDKEIKIPAYQKTRLKIVFKPKDDGKKSAELIIFSADLDGNLFGRYIVNLFSEKYTFELSFEKNEIDFGEIEPDTIAEQWINVRNTGSILIEFPKVPIIIGNFELFEISPKVLQPWHSSYIDGIIKVRFRSPIEGEYSEEFKFIDVCNNEYSFKVKAKVKKKMPPLEKVSLVVENYNANSGDEIAISFKILNHYVLKSQNLTRLISNCKFNNTILHPIGNTPIGEIEDDFRKIRLELDISKDSIFTYKFIVALGNDSITNLDIYDTYSPGFINNIENISGEFKLNDLCYANGTRLINVDNLISLSIIQKNNDFAEISFEIIENAYTQILIYDYHGNLLETIIDENMSLGEYKAPLNLKKYGSGIYYLLMKTPTYSKAFNINLIR